MIKKTLYFGNPCYLSVKDKQLVIEVREKKDSHLHENNIPLHPPLPKVEYRTIPIEDIGVVMLDCYGAVISQFAINALLENNVAFIVCNEKHHPTGLFLPLESNALQELYFAHQINASLPLKKQLWMQTIKAKIHNQALLLQELGREYAPMFVWEKEVKSGDTTNRESRAAVYYWNKLFEHIFEGSENFSRERYGAPPNNLLNYGYAILRAIVARSLVGSGLLPTLGIHHHNQYNAYCLADDVMEPYRPFVDRIVVEIVREKGRRKKDEGINQEVDLFVLTPAMKKKLLEIPVLDVQFDDETSPLMVGLQRTTASLARCFDGSEKEISYPKLGRMKDELGIKKEE